MKKVLALLVFLVSLPLVGAAPLEIAIDPSEATIHSDTYISFILTIKNNDPVAHDAIISVKGDKPWWQVPVNLLIPLPAAGEKKIAQDFYPVDAENGTYHFEVAIRFFDDPTIAASDLLSITILPDVFLTTLEAVREGEEVRAKVGVDSLGEREVEFSFDILNPSGQVITSLSTTEKIAGVTTIQKSISLPPKLPPGGYSLRVKMGDNLLTASFTVEEVRTLEKRTETISTHWYKETIITATNTGNVPQTFETEQTFASGDLITGLVTDPTSCVEANNRKKCTYSVTISPSETREIRYRKELWPVYAQTGAGALAIALVGVFTTAKYTKPKINKRYRKQRAGTSILLEVKNNFTKNTKNVIVRDWISPLAQVVMEEFGSVRPLVRRSDAGTELIWSLGDMRPREVRLLSYRVQPIVQGDLKLSRASLRYKSRGGEVKRVVSKPVFID